MSDLYAGAAGDQRPIPVADGVIRMPVPSEAFRPFPADDFRTARRLAHIVGAGAAGEREKVVRQLVAQALEELGRAHLAVCIAPGMDCDECWWLSKAIAPARAAGWLR